MYTLYNAGKKISGTTVTLKRTIQFLRYTNKKLKHLIFTSVIFEEWYDMIFLLSYFLP